MDSTTSVPTSHPVYTGPTAQDIACIPEALKARNQWVLWRAKDRIDQQAGAIIGLNKIPYTVHPDQKASSTDPQTWASFQRCVDALPLALEEWELTDPAAYRGGGIGYVFTVYDPYCGIDLDHSFDYTGTVAPWASAIVQALDSYTQRSCSGSGLHVVIQGRLPPGRCQDGDLQMWDHDRFFAMTGWHVTTTPAAIEARQGRLDALWCKHFGAQIGDLVYCIDDAGVITNPAPWAIARINTAPDGTPYAQFAESITGWRLSRCEPVPPALTSGQPTSPPMADDIILQKARAAANGAKFAKLWDGDWTGYTSQSEADLALCILLAFYTQDPEQLNQLFEQSGLYRADKWGKRFDYRRRTITSALEKLIAHYQPLPTLHVNGTAPDTDTATLAQQLYDALIALPDDERTPDTLFLALGDLIALPADQWAIWKTRFKQVLGKRLNLNDLQSAYNATKRQAVHAHRDTQRQADRRPVIRFDTDITGYTDKGQAALLRLPDAPIYQRARRLSIITRSGKAPRWLHRPPDVPTIVPLTPDYLRELAGQAARWEQADGKGETYEISPPQLFVDTLLARPAWPFPVLEGIIHSPTLRPDGSVLDQPGYDPTTGLFYDPDTTPFPPISDAPDVFEVEIALNILKDALCDFPFVQPYDQAAALAACLSMVCRFAIPGCVPLFAVTAPVRGSGKSYLVDTLSIIGTGRPAPRWPQVIDPDEERKRLLTVALAGYPAIHIDNVSRPLGSPALDLALTSMSFSDRILGQTGSVEAPLNMVWFCSGNNVQYQGDTGRRVVPITIDPVMEKPEERSGFKHDPLIPWVMAERPRLTVAALTVVKAYCTAGCPKQRLSTYGSFEPWSDLIRSALVWAGEADCNEGRKDIEATSNPDHEIHAGVLVAWHTCYGTKAVTLKEVIGDIGQRQQHAGPGVTRNEWNDLCDALAACDRRFDGKTLDARRIGNDLRTWQGRFINGLRLISPGKDRKGYALWRVEGSPITP